MPSLTPLCHFIRLCIASQIEDLACIRFFCRVADQRVFFGQSYFIHDPGFLLCDVLLRLHTACYIFLETLLFPGPSNIFLNISAAGTAHFIGMYLLVYTLIYERVSPSFTSIFPFRVR